MVSASKDKQLTGAAGEHLVLSRLLSRELLASQAPRGTRKADILVNPLDGGRPVLIQVKTRSVRGGALSWIMSVKNEGMRESDLFYCLVDLDLVNPSVYVVPSQVVADVISTAHAEWLATPGKNGKIHQDSETRQLKNDYGPNFRKIEPNWMEKYLENWELIS